MGILYIIATPIGNLGDITLRALEVLKSVDLVVCEDTRQTVKLLNHFNITKPLASFFQHSKLSKIEYIAGQLARGKNIALVTDAGTPGISDPGNKLVGQLVSRSVGQFEFRKQKTDELINCETDKLKIVPIPGPCAAIAALSISGFPADKFIFMGFPPHKKGRNKFFEEIAKTEHTVVFYESTHRILKTLNQLKGVLSSYQGTGQTLDRNIVVGRELTKMFESVYRGTAGEILNKLNEDKNNQKGEFVVVIKNE